MGEAAISQNSKKQTVIPQSSMDSEFFALYVGGNKVVWLNYFLRDLSLKKLQGAITIYCDNQTASVVASNSLFNGKKRDIRLNHGYLNKLICH